MSAPRPVDATTAAIIRRAASTPSAQTLGRGKAPVPA